MSVLIGVDMGGTNLRVGVVERAAVRWEHKVNTRFSERLDWDDPARSTGILLRELHEALRVTLERHPDVEALGIAVPGIVDPRTGVLHEAPNIPGIRDLDLAGTLAQQLRLPCVVENDALAAAWGAYQTHPDRPESLVFAGLGTGIGGGLVLAGQPYRGQHGFAMEIGHLKAVEDGRTCGCGARGCLERYASATGVSLSYQEATGELLNSAAVAHRAREGDRAALDAFARAGTLLGTAIAGLMKVLDVTDLVIGGGLCASWDLMESAFHRSAAAESMGPLRDRYTLRVLGQADDLGMLGAALLSKHLKESLT